MAKSHIPWLEWPWEAPSLSGARLPSWSIARATSGWIWTPSIYRSSSNFHIWACLNCPRHALQFALCVWGKCGGVSRLKDSASPSSCLDCWMLLQISSFSRTTAWCRQLNENVLNASTLSSQEWFLDLYHLPWGRARKQCIERHHYEIFWLTWPSLHRSLPT